MDPRYKSPTAAVERDESGEFRDLEQFTNMLKWLLWGGALMATLFAASSWQQYQMLLHHFTVEEARTNLVRQAAIGGLSLLLRLVTVVVFARWIVLAHRNLNPLGCRYPDITPGWAVGWFFIPFANWWMPYKAMRLLWRASRDARSPTTQRVTWVLPMWWSLWIGCQFVVGITYLAFAHSTVIEGIRAATLGGLLGALLYFLLYLVASTLIVRVWHAQRRQRENPGEFAPL